MVRLSHVTILVGLYKVYRSYVSEYCTYLIVPKANNVLSIDKELKDEWVRSRWSAKASKHLRTHEISLIRLRLLISSIQLYSRSFQAIVKTETKPCQEKENLNRHSTDMSPGNEGGLTMDREHNRDESIFRMRNE